MITYSLAKPGEEAKLLDFANYVFSQAHRPHDFRTLLPKVYGEGVQNADMHYVAEESDGSIRAMLCVLPLELTIAGSHIKCGVVGSVSVHPYYRGEGYMKQLMQMMMDDCASRGFDVLALSGQRQRYNYFGFDYAGACAEYIVSRDSIRHTQAAADISGYTLNEIKSNDDPLCEKCWELYEKGPIHGGRPKQRYLQYAQSWQSGLHAILKNGVFIGSLIDNSWDGKAIKEILLYDESEIGAVLKLWFARNPDAHNTAIRVWPYEQERMDALNGLCEKMNIIPGQMIKVLNWERTIRAAMNLSASYRPLQDGRTTMRIGNETICLSVENGVASVKKTALQPDRSFSEIDAVRYLFSHSAMLNCGKDTLYNWLPLPWVMPSPDRF